MDGTDRTDATDGSMGQPLAPMYPSVESVPILPIRVAKRVSRIECNCRKKSANCPIESAITACSLCFLSEVPASHKLAMEYQIFLIRSDSRMLRYLLHSNYPPIVGSLRHNNANNANEISSSDKAIPLVVGLLSDAHPQSRFAGFPSEARGPLKSFHSG